MEDEIAAWLRAQAEADIKAAGVATDGPWEIDGSAIRGAARSYSGGKPRDVLVVKHTWRQEAEHVIRHDPRTEAARAESVLAVLRLYDVAVTVAEAKAGPAKSAEVLRLVVRDLAAGYRFREGFKEEWKS